MLGPLGAALGGLERPEEGRFSTRDPNGNSFLTAFDLKSIQLEDKGNIIYHIMYPRTQLTSIFEGQPSKTGPFPIKTRVIWVLGILYYIHFTEYLVPLSGISLPIVCKYICYLPLLNQKPSLKSQFHSFSSARKKARFNAKKIGRNVT